MILKICGGNFKNVSPNEKKWLQEGNSDTSPREIFHVYIIYVNISLNSFTLELIRTWEFFKKLKYHSPFKLIPNWSWNRMITCTNVYFECVFHYKSCQPIVDLRFNLVWIYPPCENIISRMDVFWLHHFYWKYAVKEKKVAYEPCGERVFVMCRNTTDNPHPWISRTPILITQILGGKWF